MAIPTALENLASDPSSLEITTDPVQVIKLSHDY
jgi:hypothetical protein